MQNVSGPLAKTSAIASNASIHSCPTSGTGPSHPPLPQAATAQPSQKSDAIKVGSFAREDPAAIITYRLPDGRESARPDEYMQPLPHDGICLVWPCSDECRAVHDATNLTDAIEAHDAAQLITDGADECESCPLTVVAAPADASSFMFAAALIVADHAGKRHSFWCANAHVSTAVSAVWDGDQPWLSEWVCQSLNEAVRQHLAMVVK